MKRLLLLLFLTLISVPGRAQEGEAQMILRSILEGMPGAVLSEDLQLFHRSHAIAPLGEGYRVTLGDVGFHDAGDGAPLLLGDLAFTVKPQSDGTYWWGDATIPNRLELPDEAGVIDVILSFEAAQLEGIWWPDINGHRSYSHTLEGVVIEAADAAWIIKIPRLTGTLESVPAGALWDQVFRFEARGFSGSGEGAVFSVGRLGLYGTAFGIDVGNLKKLETLGLSLAAAVAADDRATYEELRQEILKLPPSLSAFSVRFEGADSFSLDDHTGQRDSLGYMAFGLDLRNLEKELATLKLVMESRDYAVDTEESDEALWIDLLPTAVRFPLVIDRLPAAELSQIFNIIISLPTALEAHQDDVLDFDRDAYLHDMRRVGTKILIPNATVTTPLGEHRLDGELVFDLKAERKVRGRLELFLAGAQQIVALFDSDPGNEEMAAVFSGLRLFFALGKKSQDAEGNEILRFLFEVPSAGNPVLNGLPIPGMGE